ncbi:secreted protein containing DUF1588 [Rhodopirellula maiorica SM1]|uniref:Secreted protein containing DUF1588 n=1 Tax=Rhodopirellula maiorica SM1 TaxID=1265738 RepID=M5RM04_9BACT|nr:DUF1592 domain-containing protein [Rhodopirellula maiorica]EMI20343.1 secreted protein containing DUF1588 [Rhodopirellula maiorica SM1]
MPFRAIIVLLSIALCFSWNRTVVAEQDATAEKATAAPETATQENGSDDLQAAVQAWQKTGWPLVERLCVDCHDSPEGEAGLDLNIYQDIQSIDADLGSVERVLEIVRFGAMPPEDADLPTDVERKALVESLEQILYSVACNSRRTPGNATTRRLNRSEYNNTIRDLFHVDLRPANAFPSDEVGGGFDNNGDVLTLSPLLIEKYFEAAETVASHVIIDPETLPKLNADLASDRLFVRGDSKTGSFNGRFLAPEAYVWTEVEVPVDGEYSVRLYGGVTDKEAKPGQFGIFDNDGILLAKYELGYFGGSGSSQSKEQRFKLKKGLYRFRIAPLADDAEVGKTKFEQQGDLTAEVIAKQLKDSKKALQPSGKFDLKKYSNLVRRLRLDGPRGSRKSELPKSHLEIVRKTASYDSGKKQWKNVVEAASECLKPLMQRAFRGPVTDDEVKQFASLVEIATKRDESYYRGLQIAVTGILMSPRFLFRVETPADDQSADGKLTQHQLATRLSYFLWSSTPDEALMKDADAGKLKGKAIEDHVRRMLKDDRADALGSEFAAQWLGLRNLKGHEADEKLFPKYNDALATAMSEETERLFMHLVRENRPAHELLTADYTFLNPQLASFYNTKHSGTDEFERVSLKSTPRRGVLSHASVLTLTSNPNRTSPVQRGKWILENILGTPPPDPPAGVPELEETQTADANASFREQLEIHRADPSCAACHRVMDQLGFGLEQFDAVGQFRESTAKSNIDASGELPGGRRFSGAADLAEMLGNSEKDAFARTAIRRLLTFSLGRELSPADRCVIELIAENTAKEEYRFTDLILEVVRSSPFHNHSRSN